VCSLRAAAKKSERPVMQTIILSIITFGLIVYLVFTIIRPEKF
jgi:K+-transporting ATPase KdpF subunit